MTPQSSIETGTQAAHDGRGTSDPRVVDNIINDCLAFLIPCFLFLEVDAIGRLFVPEILLALMLPLLIVTRGRALAAPLPKRMIVLGMLWLASQIVTDLIRGSTFVDYSRGWSKIFFTVTNFAAIALLLGLNRRRILLFGIGLTIGQLLACVINPSTYQADQPWKFGFAIPVTQAAILMTMTPLLASRRFLPAIVLVALAAVDLVNGARSLAGISFIAAVYIIFQSYAAGKWSPARSTKSPIKSMLSRAILVTSLTISAICLSLTYQYLASNGVLGKDAESKYISESAGEYGLLLGGRPESMVAVQAIIDSPIIGHGSWAKDRHYIDLLRTLSAPSTSGGVKPDLTSVYSLGAIPTHSHLLGAWVEAGICGGLFWIFVLWLSFDVLCRLSFIRDPFTPLIAFWGGSLIWDILFSPYGADRRLTVPYLVLLLIFADTVIKFRVSRQRPDINRDRETLPVPVKHGNYAL